MKIGMLEEDLERKEKELYEKQIEWRKEQSNNSNLKKEISNLEKLIILQDVTKADHHSKNEQENTISTKAIQYLNSWK